VRFRVENEESLAVIERVVRNYREARRSGEGAQCFCPASGITWHMQTPEGQALLGTPNGSGVAGLLAQHNAELGHKTVESVTLFWDKGSIVNGKREDQDRPSMVFRLRVVVDEEGT
jgi:hypothetical protein